MDRLIAITGLTMHCVKSFIVILLIHVFVHSVFAIDFLAIRASKSRKTLSQSPTIASNAVNRLEETWPTMSTMLFSLLLQA